MAAGAALEVKQAGGEEIELAAVRQGPIPLGEVTVTGAGALPLAGVIHAAVMGQDLRVDATAAAKALSRSLEVAAVRHWTHLLIHSFHGAGKGTRRETIQTALSALIDELLEGCSLRQITLLALDEGERSALHEDLLHLIQRHA
ncbi:MAG: macro domain-containing protein [Ignavibacteriaceae bacterium]|nr:macro domain-containing protein [Ignavibacteriaceae bacterium]